MTSAEGVNTLRANVHDGCLLFKGHNDNLTLVFNKTLDNTQDFYIQHKSTFYHTYFIYHMVANKTSLNLRFQWLT